MPVTDADGIEALLRQELARGDLALAGVAPVLTHLLVGSGQSLVSDAIVAHMRGMLGDIARQLLNAQAMRADESRAVELSDTAHVDALANRLVGSTVVLSHAYALAVEAEFANNMEQTAGIDPVLSPLLQELIASDQESIAATAMAAMAAQARFMQSQRRMGLPLTELPSELFHQTLSRWRRFSSDAPAEELALTEKQLREAYDEGASRLGLLTQLISALKGGVAAALELEHAGISLFASALASTTRQPRELAILSCHEGQVARLALTLRAAGLKTEDVARQILLVHPDITLPEGFAALSEREALALLGGARGASQGARQA